MLSSRTWSNLLAQQMVNNILIVLVFAFLVLSLIIAVLSFLLHRITTPPSTNQSSRSVVELVDKENNEVLETLIVPGKYLVYSGEIGNGLERYGSFSSYTFVQTSDFKSRSLALEGAPQDRGILSAQVTALNLSRNERNSTSATDFASRFSLNLVPILQSTQVPGSEANIVLTIDATIYSHP